MSYKTDGSMRCDWPWCESWYDAATGPSERGWIWPRPLGMDVLLCPVHAEAGHVPQTRIIENGDRRVLVSCSCGWSGAGQHPTRAAAQHCWQEHVDEKKQPARSMWCSR